MSKMKNKYYQNIRGICIIAVCLIHLLIKQEDIGLNYFNIILRTFLNFCVGIFVFFGWIFCKYRKS